MIEVAHLGKQFGDFTAVDDLSFTVGRGEVVGFLGPNGAGKSTSMKMLTGFLRPSAGTAHICGFDVGRDLLWAQAHFGYLPEGAPVWPDMTPRQFLQFVTDIRGLDKSQARTAREQVIELTQLQAVLDQPVDTLSKGYRRRVGLAQAIVHNPDVLIMDEPTDGLDPNQKAHIRTAIQNMMHDKAILISTHILEEVEAICTRAIIINDGRIVAQGTPSQLASRSQFAGAVLLVADSVKADHIETILHQNLPDGVRMTQTQRGDETRFSLFSALSDTQKSAALLQKVQNLAAHHSWPVRALALETGRLDDVFARLTGAGENPPQNKQSNK